MVTLKDTLFIQFYTEKTYKKSGAKILIDNDYVELENTPHVPSYYLSNGFSSSYHSLKNIGEFHWVKYDLNGTLHDIVEKNKNLELPIKKGTVYVSAYFNCHLYQTYIWALKYPSIIFHVGGSAVDKKKIQDKLPKNLFLTENDIDSILPSEKIWGITLPENIKGKILLGYTVERNCYWGKCNFCTYPDKENIITFDPHFIKSLDNNHQYQIFLNSPALSPRFIKNEMPRLINSPNIEYWSHLRCDNKTIEACKLTLEKLKINNFHFKNFIPLTGVEMPSNRMLNEMNKGSSLKHILEFFKLFKKYNCQPAISLIFGWNSLISKDIENAKTFFNELYQITEGKCIIKCHSLAAKTNSILEKQISNAKHVQLGPFSLGVIPHLSEKQLKLNLELKEALYDTKFYYLIDASNNKYNDFL